MKSSLSAREHRTLQIPLSTLPYKLIQQILSQHLPCNVLNIYIYTFIYFIHLMLRIKNITNQRGSSWKHIYNAPEPLLWPPRP